MQRDADHCKVLKYSKYAEFRVTLQCAAPNKKRAVDCTMIMSRFVTNSKGVFHLVEDQSSKEQTQDGDRKSAFTFLKDSEPQTMRSAYLASPLS